MYGHWEVRQIKQIAVGTDRSLTATPAVDLAAEIASRYGAELLLIQVLLPGDPPGTEAGQAEAMRASQAAEELRQIAVGLAGSRGHARVIVDADPAMAIVRAAEEVGADLLVVGNVGMAGRREFLLGNVPNRVSHNARCSVLIVNTTPDVARGAPARGFDARTGSVVAGPERETTDAGLMGRSMRIGAVMAKHGVRYLFSRGKGEDNVRAQARRLCEAMEELGPTFAKLGQVLSTRPDLLPPEFIEELATLQDHCPPLTEQEVVQVMEQELGVPWEDVFECIEPQPMAAGTIAQVHKAALTDGSRVVVKVQRPSAEGDILRDLGLFRLFAEKTEDRPAIRQVIDMPAVVAHLSESLKRELDFTTELESVERMRRVLAPYSRLDVPAVYKEYSTPRLLVMEEIQGVPIRQSTASSERTEAARQLLESYYRQILTDGFFHADPHPGNLMWWQDKIYFIDFGMVGEVGPELRELLILMLLAFWQEDVAFLADVVLMIAGADQRPDIDVPAFQAELGGLLARYRHVSLEEMQLGPILQEMTEISIRHDVPLPASLALTGKALAQMQLVTAELDPTLDPFAVAGQFLMRKFRDEVKGRMDPQKLFYESQKLRMRTVRFVESMERLTGARPGPKLQVNFRGTERLEDNIRRAGRRLSLALVAGALWIGTAFAAASADVASWVPPSLAGLGGVVTLGLGMDLLRRRA
jgi:predicted unusual protein kinase regulating ubiquinone biosynthesis (AarF/ABC1/UbiB family)/nucleotide-binding universal stress UspA family protein